MDRGLPALRGGIRPRPAGRPAFSTRIHPGPWASLEKSLARPRETARGKLELAPWLAVMAALLLPLDVGLRRYNA